MSCVSGQPANCKPTGRRALALALWTPEERARQRRVIEERLVDAWAWKAQVGALRDPERPWRLLEGNGVTVVVKPPWQPSPGAGPHYSQPALDADERDRLAIEALTWLRRYLKPLAQSPRGSRPREKWETFQLWLNCRAHRPGYPTFDAVWRERAGGDKTLYRKLSRRAYRRVERAIRLVKLGLFTEGVTPEPLPRRKK